MTSLWLVGLMLGALFRPAPAASFASVPDRIGAAPASGSRRRPTDVPAGTVTAPLGLRRLAETEPGDAGDAPLAPTDPRAPSPAIPPGTSSPGAAAAVGAASDEPPSSPPPGLSVPSPAAQASPLFAAQVPADVPPAATPTPWLERWWFWTAVATVGVTVFVIVAATSLSAPGPPATELGNRVAF